MLKTDTSADDGDLGAFWGYSLAVLFFFACLFVLFCFVPFVMAYLTEPTVSFYLKEKCCKLKMRFFQLGYNKTVSQTDGLEWVCVSQLVSLIASTGVFVELIICCTWMWGTDSLLSDGSCYPRTPCWRIGIFFLGLHPSQVPCREADLCPSREPGFMKCRRLCWLWFLGGSKTSVVSCVKVIQIILAWPWATLFWVVVTRSQCVLVIWCDHFPCLLYCWAR